VSHGSPQGRPGAERDAGNQPGGLPRTNSEVQYFLRDVGFMAKSAPIWRELHAREHKLHGADVIHEAVAQRLGGWS